MSGTARILVVEDEAVVAMDVRGQLEALGYRVVATTGDAGEAERLAAELAPDLVLMDIRLEAGGDGVATGLEVRRTLGIPVVFLTALADGETLARAAEIAPHGYVVKPFDDRELATAVEIALSRRRAEAALERRHDELGALLDAQRHGSIAVEPDGAIGFVSRVARRLLGLGDAGGTSTLGELPLAPPALAAIREAAALPAAERGKISVFGAEAGDGGRYAIEVEVVDDPRAAGGLFLFLYDVTELRRLERRLERADGFEEMVGTSEAMRRVYRRLDEVARVDSPVLVTGETGTGKELAARAIHRRSRRSRGPFLAVNAGGLGDELAMSQLFGHRQGAFTGAVDHRPGMFEAADGGTLFLDEIGELSPRVQAMLLRVLDERAVSRLGETRQRPVDVRLITATHRDVDAAGEGVLRRDLVYRIRVARIELPPLRERGDDVVLLAETFLADARERVGKAVAGFGVEALRLLLAYPWPGNVRELKHAVEHAVIHAAGAEVEAADLPSEVAAADAAEAGEPELIRAALERTGGNRKEAARLLGISRATLYRRLERLGIDRPEEPGEPGAPSQPAGR